MKKRKKSEAEELGREAEAGRREAERQVEERHRGRQKRVREAGRREAEMQAEERQAEMHGRGGEARPIFPLKLSNSVQQSTCNDTIWVKCLLISKSIRMVQEARGNTGRMITMR
ncbi:hypothetical protein Pmani_006090 [Petrolisthes manimaculis]|uniref:Uncharacterized protein n=1 Tax=Petrolisthes manimaculis TaxID=1843537 RepID=A0AAE1QAZ2_9EUCA|nr:hypothetical protein Pmani_006090 [Petrolisthes manimaculis]